MQWVFLATFHNPKNHRLILFANRAITACQISDTIRRLAAANLGVSAAAIFPV